MSLGYADKLKNKRNLGGQLGAQEYFESKDSVEEKACLVAEWIREKGKVFFFTGAGISTSCGIPDFRGPNGIWTLRKKGKPIPSLFTPFEYACPSLTHQSIRAMVDAGLVTFVCSQNVDNLHQRSGVPRATSERIAHSLAQEQEQAEAQKQTQARGGKSQGKSGGSLSLPAFERASVLPKAQSLGSLLAAIPSSPSSSAPALLAELHGNCFCERCERCGAEYIRDWQMETVGQKRTGRTCPAPGCAGNLYDNVLDWDTPLPEDELDLAIQRAEEAALMLVLGTSLQIAPANELPSIARKNGARVVIVNLQRTPRDRSAAALVRARADHFMAALMRRLEIQIPRYRREESLAVTQTTEVSSLNAKKAEDDDLTALCRDARASGIPEEFSNNNGNGSAAPVVKREVEKENQDKETNAAASGVSSSRAVIATAARSDAKPPSLPFSDRHRHRHCLVELHGCLSRDTPSPLVIRAAELAVAQDDVSSSSFSCANDGQDIDNNYLDDSTAEGAILVKDRPIIDLIWSPTGRSSVSDQTAQHVSKSEPRGAIKDQKPKIQIRPVPPGTSLEEAVGLFYRAPSPVEQNVRVGTTDDDDCSPRRFAFLVTAETGGADPCLSSSSSSGHHQISDLRVSCVLTLHLVRWADDDRRTVTFGLTLHLGGESHGAAGSEEAGCQLSAFSALPTSVYARASQADSKSSFAVAALHQKKEDSSSPPASASFLRSSTSVFQFVSQERSYDIDAALDELAGQRVVPEPTKRQRKAADQPPLGSEQCPRDDVASPAGTGDDGTVLLNATSRRTSARLTRSGARNGDV